MAHHDKCKTPTPRRDAAVQHEVPKPGPEEYLACYLKPSVPPGWTLARTETEDQVLPGKPIKVEPTHSQDGVVQVLLITYHELREGVVSHNTLVVCASQAVEKSVRDREERHVLDIRIVFRTVCYDVVDIMTSLPPTHGETAQEVGDEDPDAGVYLEVVRYAHVSRIMGCEDELVPECS